MNNALTEPVLCRILAHEEERGNFAAERQTGWSKMDLVVVMEKPLDHNYVERAARNTEARIFSFHDPHYGNAQYGIAAGRESVVGPAPAGTE